MNRPPIIFDDIAIGFLSAKDREIIDSLYEYYQISTEIHFSYKRATGYSHSLERMIIFSYVCDDRKTEEHFIMSHEKLSEILKNKLKECHGEH